MFEQYGGAQEMEASGVVVGTGVPLILYGIAITCTGSAGLVSIYNNSGSANPPTLEINGEAGKRIFYPISPGVAFTDDCYIDLDANVQAVTPVFITLGPAKPLSQPAAYATGQITFSGDASNLAGVVINVGGATLTEGVDWNKSTTPGTCATRLAAAINAKAASAGCTANPGGSDLVLTALVIGSEGNRNILTASTLGSGQLTLSGATLTGGQDAVPEI